MAPILKKLRLSPNSVSLIISVPAIAKKVAPGQFVIVRCDEKSERIPFTVADWDTGAGTITLFIQEVGRSTRELGAKNNGDSILDIVGPLGTPSDIEYFGKAVCVGGGFGIAAIYPVIRALKEKKNTIISIIGARTKDLLIMEDKLRSVSDEVKISTEDGSAGAKGLVTDILKELLDRNQKPDSRNQTLPQSGSAERSEAKPDNRNHSINNQPNAVNLVYAVGPVLMMKKVCELTKPLNIKTIVSLNPIMLDGTGMCGACRITLNNKTKFTCVDGPDFDGSLVDFDCLIRRQSMYKNLENQNS